MRAVSIKHVEYAVLSHLLDKVDLSDLEIDMAPDDASAKRFSAGAKNILKIIEGLADRRRHLLPTDHPHYKEKEATQ
mgnify:CR=1 FL=1|tara:strand:- start:31726 stop:31956 length:231 start_codon:yes stop_codon:yes gene_type:complete